jgi:hypothetical protein
VQLRLAHQVKSDELGQVVVGNLIDDLFGEVCGHHLFLASLLIDRAVVAREIAGISNFQINYLESFHRRPPFLRNIPDAFGRSLGYTAVVAAVSSIAVNAQNPPHYTIVNVRLLLQSCNLAAFRYQFFGSAL